MVSPVIEVLTLGDELLLGLTPNSHLTFLGEQLARRGTRIRRNIVITDDAADIEAQFRESWERATLVITTGGLGPTCDDRTREAIAGVLGQPLVFDASVMDAIEARFARFGRKPTPNNAKQACRPRDAEVLPNPNGTAPGLWFSDGRRILVMLPGPPNELQPMWTDTVVPRLAQAGFLADRETYVQIRTAGIGESALETRLEPLLTGREGVSVAFCAHHGFVDVRLSSDNGHPPLEELQALARTCAHELGEDFYCLGHDSLANVVSDRLRTLERRLAVAESCTGGLLANCFTDLPGASKVFAGGVVCYSNDAKRQMLDVPWDLLEQHGAVSAETAVAMATGAAERMTSEYALAITGFAGPGGGTVRDPVGTVYLGLHAPEGIWCRKVNYPGSRTAVKQRAVSAALDWLRRTLP